MQRIGKLSGATAILAVGVVLVLLASAVVPLATLGASPTSAGNAPGRSTTPPSAPQSPARAPRSLVADSFPSGPSPHPGLLQVYEQGPLSSVDPSVAYSTSDVEPIINVYQTLVAYNGSSTTNFVPELSTCVPGSGGGIYSTTGVSCESAYGSSLIVDNVAGVPQFVTFPIDPAAQFFDPSTGVSWSVYPSDVMFSFARTLGFANLPYLESQPGWIQAQALLPNGNASWDGGIHALYNNTPQNVLGSMLVNNTTYCPTLALDENGCLTFDFDGGGISWPFFMDLLANPLGGSVEPCGWYTYEGAGVPGFAGTSASDGDGPCYLPGGATNTSQASFQSYLTSTSPTAWDSFEELADDSPAVQPNVQFNAVGSGPYFLAAVEPSGGYSLGANPAYSQPTGCAGVGGGCEPAAGAYIPNVQVFYTTNDTAGLEAYNTGTADMAWATGQNTTVLFQLLDEGKIGLFAGPEFDTTLEGYFFQFANTTTQSATGIPTNIPANFFSYVGMREFLSQAFPYGTFLGPDNTVNGVNLTEGLGGAIPQDLASYYPTNISWPGYNTSTTAWSNPSENPSVPGSAGWWWAEITNPSSPYYDPEAAACEVTECDFPLVSVVGQTALTDALDNLIVTVGLITSGALNISVYNANAVSDALNYYSESPGTSPYPTGVAGWIADYPDPTDYMAPFYEPDGTYTATPALNETFVQDDYGGTYNGCGSHAATDQANLIYWASQSSSTSVVPQDCQGTAYRVMTWGLDAAAGLPNGAERTLYYNLAEHVANALALYLMGFQSNEIYTYASWINGSSINTNPLQGGAGAQTWYSWQYQTSTSSVTFQETGLPTDYNWTVDFGGTVQYANGTSSTTLTSVDPGNYSYSIGYLPGYSVNIANGTVLVAPPATATVNVVFSANPGAGSLSFEELGLASGTAWSVVIAGIGSASGSSAELTFAIPSAGSPYTYSVATSVGYSASPGTGSSPTGTVVPINFTGYLFTTYPITVVPLGLPGSTSWTMTLDGYTNTSVGGQNMTFWEPNGGYFWTIASISDYESAPSSGFLGVASAPAILSVTFTYATPYPVTFAETGLPLSTPWSVVFNGTTQNSGASSIVLSEHNGTYPFTIAQAAGEFPTPGSGNVTVFGAAVTVYVSFLTQSLPLEELLSLYESRPDLQIAFPNADNGSISSLAGLVSWASQVASGQFSDSASPTLSAPGLGYYYALMGVYNSRADLQAAFPNAYTDPSSYSALTVWAGEVVTGQILDSANATLAPWGYAYVLYMIYAERPDLQAAFPNAFSTTNGENAITDWAGEVVTGQFTDSANATLQQYGYWYALMYVYNGRLDLQAAFPDAYTNESNFTALVTWAGEVVTQSFFDSSYTTLKPFGYYYDLMMVYNGRPDLQAAFPFAYQNWSSYTDLIAWAAGVVSGTYPDSASADLGLYASYYETH